MNDLQEIGWIGAALLFASAAIATGLAAYGVVTGRAKEQVVKRNFD